MGFRSPSQQSMITALCDFICQSYTPPQLLYSDPNLQVQPMKSSFISHEARKNIRLDIKTSIFKCLENEKVFDFWLGKYLTVPLRMQLRKPKPFFLKDYKKCSLRSLMIENNLVTSGKKGVVDDVMGGILDTGLSSYEYDEDDDDYDDDNDSDGDGDGSPFFLREPYRIASRKIYENMNELFVDFRNNQVYLRRREGVKMAYVESFLFVDGEVRF